MAPQSGAAPDLGFAFGPRAAQFHARGVKARRPKNFQGGDAVNRHILSNLVLLMPVCCVLLACSQKPTTFTVKIEQKGKDGAAVGDGFADSVNGVCNTAEGGGRQAHELFGAGNFTASFQGSFISCTARAKNASNTLIMTITKPDGSVVGTAQNSQPGGQVVVSGS
jgi:hypothetical protein